MTATERRANRRKKTTDRAANKNRSPTVRGLRVSGTGAAQCDVVNSNSRQLPLLPVTSLVIADEKSKKKSGVDARDRESVRRLFDSRPRGRGGGAFIGLFFFFHLCPRTTCVALKFIIAAPTADR